MNNEMEVFKSNLNVSLAAKTLHSFLITSETVKKMCLVIFTPG